MKFLIPSYKRAGMAQSVDYLLDVGVDGGSIYIATQNEQDKKAYDECYGSLVNVVYREAHNCAGNRNTLAELIGDEMAMFMDDDVFRFEKTDEIGVALDSEGIESMVEEISAEMKRRGVYLAGMFNNQTPSGMKQRNKTNRAYSKNQIINGAAMIVRPNPEIRFDETLECYDDIEISLRHIQLGFGTLRSNRYRMCKRMDQQGVGGCAETYANGGQRRVIEELERRYYPMAKHSPEWKTMVVRRGLA